MAKTFVGVRIEPDILNKLDAMAKQTGRDRSRLMSEAIALLVGAEVEPTGDRLDRMQRQIDELMLFRENFTSLEKASRLVTR
jgi:predicted transcriptional regulator